MAQNKKQVHQNLTGETRLNYVLDNIPGALEYIVSLKPRDFKRLYNPFLRKYMSPRISLNRVAAMSGITTARLLQKLAELSGGEQNPQEPDSAPSQVVLPQSPRTAPSWLENIDTQKLHWVDLLPIDAAGGDPFPPVSVAVKQLAPGNVLGIRHRWEPQPMYDIWQKMRLEWFARQISPDEWHIFVYKPAAVLSLARPPTIYVELRHLLPAEMIPRLIAMFEQLQPGQNMEVSGAPDTIAEQLEATFEARYKGKYSWYTQENTSKGRLIHISRPKS